ncbi:MAG: bifunctional phosphopantothenoylcysteine decarboxylase/phosphopantothenate--cysteine ligase CoaBC [Actinomycetia bacterium]|nr:bifunctional phosphopantothenoylcysteine decarboxylase/phosphopantothenate--cysteine ligase CoaBC [Actinomycetes bacterium]MCP4084588.1 bifunctional phosphopantothenoylcysteine decarboxylase/phosphopantothenate--cysteine ligase CoaBC [Actinomycetes bacterium]
MSAETPSPESRGARIVLGVTGGIAAYKAIEVCRRLVDAGHHVVPVLTEGARRFVGETTFSALASEKVQSSLWDEASPIPHTLLGQSADLILVCPATARLLSDLRTGRSEDLLTATLIATRAPVLVCPAMHTEMWEHPSVQDNLAVLAQRGVHIVPPEEGRLAGGDSGAGRLAAPATVVQAVHDVLGAASGAADMVGSKVVVTAGGTREPIDPVRYVGNRSSGRQGYAFAVEARARGAEVTVVGTVAPPPEWTALLGGVEIVRVETAAEMEQATTAAAAGADMVVMAAAVADFRPADPADQKIKKAHLTDDAPEVLLERTPDILAGLGAHKPDGQILIGFAAETSDVRQNANAKLRAKNADLIVANDVSAPGVGFEHTTNAVVVLGPDGLAVEIPLTDKRAVARAVLDVAQSL